VRRSPLEGACALERCGTRSRGRETSSEAKPARGGVHPRARQNLLEGAFDWATLVGCGGHRCVGRVVCACLGKGAFCFVFCRF
jgi:hypothetical protein